MTKPEVLELLKAGRDAKGEAAWKKRNDTDGLQSFGIGLSKLRAIAKKIGRDHELALKLWNENNHDAKVVALLIDDPKLLTREQIEDQVNGVGPGLLSHVLSSCDATLPKSPIAFEIAKDWMKSKDPVRKSCGYGLVYEMAKNTKDERLTDDFFLGCIEKIGKTIDKEGTDVRVAMGAALMGAGRRNKKLNTAAVKVAKAVGPISTSDGNKTGSLDVLKHLTNEFTKNKIGK